MTLLMLRWRFDLELKRIVRLVKKILIKSRCFNLFIDQRMPLQDVLDANSECFKSRIDYIRALSVEARNAEIYAAPHLPYVNLGLPRGSARLLQIFSSVRTSKLKNFKCPDFKIQGYNFRMCMYNAVAEGKAPLKSCRNRHPL